MLKVFILNALLGISMPVFAQQASQACDLDGGGKFEVSCSVERQELKIGMAGMEGEELNDISVEYKKNKYPFTPETDLPMRTFERVEDGVFTALISKNRLNIEIIGIPKSFKMRTEKLTTPQNAIQGSGTFSAVLKGFYDIHDDSTKIDSTAVCTLNFIKCPTK